MCLPIFCSFRPRSCDVIFLLLANFFSGDVRAYWTSTHFFHFSIVEWFVCSSCYGWTIAVHTFAYMAYAIYIIYKFWECFVCRKFIFGLMLLEPCVYAVSILLGSCRARNTDAERIYDHRPNIITKKVKKPHIDSERTNQHMAINYLYIHVMISGSFC